jgi:hypothetical protein
MVPMDSQNLESFVPVYDMVPEKWEDGRQFLVEHLKKISNAVNIREIGWYLDEEVLTGKAFIPSVPTPNNNSVPLQPRQILRKVVQTIPIPAGVTLVPHGIVVDSNFTLIDMWGSMTDPVALVSFTYAYSPSPDANGIQTYISGPNIVINSNTSRVSYTRSYIFIEYIQEV